MSSKKASQLAKRKLSSSDQPVNLDSSLGLMGAGGLNAAILNNQSLLGLNPNAALAMGNLGLGLGVGDLRADRATASFLQPTLDSFSTSQASAGLPESVNDNAALLQSLQRQRLLLNAAQQQQNLGMLQQSFGSAGMGLAGLTNPLLAMQSLPLDLASVPQGALFSPGLNAQLANLSQQQQKLQSSAAALDASSPTSKDKDDGDSDSDDSS